MGTFLLVGGIICSKWHLGMSYCSKTPKGPNWLSPIGNPQSWFSQSHALDIRAPLVSFVSDLCLISVTPLPCMWHFAQAVFCVLNGLYYSTIVSKTEGTSDDHRVDTTCHKTQTVERDRAPEHWFSQVKATAKIQALKSTIRERTKNLTTHISHYCKTKLPGFKTAKARMYRGKAENKEVTKIGSLKWQLINRLRLGNDVRKQIFRRKN